MSMIRVIRQKNGMTRSIHWCNALQKLLQSSQGVFDGRWARVVNCGEGRGAWVWH